MHPFDPTTDWPEPDMTIGNPIRPPAPIMSDTEFNQVYGPWAQWLRNAAETKNAPIDYVALSLLTTASAAIGNSRWAVPWDGWSEPPVLWGMLVGDPSSGKSPALDAVLDPVKELEQELTETYKAQLSEWQAKDEIAKLQLAQWKSDAKTALGDGDEPPAKPDEADAGPKPVRQRIRVSDVTTEKIAVLLQSTWRGLLLSRDELSGWIGSMDRYSGGGGDRPFWLETYGGRSYTVDRKGSDEPILVDHLSVSIIGGTQPDKLDSLLVKSDDDGLLSRFVTVYPDPVPLKRPDAIIDSDALSNGLSRLRELTPANDEQGNLRPFYIHFSDTAADALHEFRRQCREWEGDASGLYKSHIGKMPGLVVRISNVLAHLDWCASTDGQYVSAIDVGHVGRARHLVGEHLRNHAFRAYGMTKLPVEVQGAKVIAGIIRSEGLRLFKVRDIQHRGRTGLATAGEVRAALNVLIDADWLRMVKEDSGGRPTVSYAVNPRLEDVS
ncbi:hypothetical protein ROA7745_04185 [Roseovarius aestuarii]|uniref:DUF3987 domain-containing protein n=1 Tax=Roseovarius aestuarii TaxID=475083 RepID=A0A1X7BYH4_9RHOB|nr:hypothetical protein ROA7745_04185 [Roseovarius aestuarii]